MTIPNIGSLDPGTYTYTMHGSYESPIAQGTNVFDGLGTTDGRMANGHGFLDCWVWLFYRENERRKEPKNTHEIHRNIIRSPNPEPFTPHFMGSEPPFMERSSCEFSAWKRSMASTENQFWSVTRNHPSKWELNFDTTLHTETDADDADWCFFCLPTTSGRSFVKYILFVESMPFLKIPRFLWVKPSSLPRPKKQMST